MLLEHKTHILFLLLACSALGGRARAQISFTPIHPTSCPQELPWSWDSLSPEYGIEPVGLATPVTQYANNQRDIRFIIANTYVNQLGFRYAWWDTQLPGDQLLMQQGTQAPVAMAGSLPTPGWFNVSTPDSLEKTAITATFSTNSSIPDSGFVIDRVRFCNNPAGGYMSSTPIIEGARYSGFLLGTNDVVRTWVRAPKSDEEINIAVWGASGLDLDVYVRCGALPTPTTYTLRGFSSDRYELLSVQSSHCLYPSPLYITAHSFSGSGRFDLVASRAYASNTTLNFTVGVEGATSQELIFIRDALKRAVKALYGATEGQLLIESIRVVSLPSGSIPADNNDHQVAYSACYPACWNATGWYCHTCFVQESGRSYSPIGLLPAIINREAWTDPDTIAHEWAHSQLAIRDEYSGSCDRCGHSIMANQWEWNNNLCIDGTHANHNLDREAGCGPTGEPAAWPTAEQLLAPPTTTPDSYDYSNHDFNGLPQLYSF